MILFTFGSLIDGAKLFAVFSGTLVFWVVFWVAARFGNPSLPSLVLLLGSVPFLYRLQFPRAQSIAITFILLMVTSLLRRQKRLLFVLAFFHPWIALAGSALVAAIFTFYLLARLLVDRRFDGGIVIWGVAGWILGQVLFPHFPANVFFSYHYVGAKLFPSTELLGGEWSSPGLSTLVRENLLLLLLLVEALVAWSIVRPRLAWDSVFLSFCASFFSVLLIISRRFVEYWAPFVVLCGACLFRDAKTSFSIAERKYLAPILIVIFSVGYFNLMHVRRWVTEDGKKPSYAQVADWIRRHTVKGELVFNQWDAFPQLFFHYPSVSYSAGLDVSYLLHPVRSRATIYEALVRGALPRPSAEIRRTFPCRYVVVSSWNRAFLSVADTDDGFRRVYQDDDAIVFEVRGGGSK